MKKLIIFVLSAIMFTGLAAQDMKNIENYRIYKMSEYLELTPEQAETFFPLLRQYEKELKDVKAREDELYRELKQIQSGKQELGEGQMEQIMNRMAACENNRIQLKQNFMKQSGKALSPGQVAKIPTFEKDFREHLKQQFLQKQKQQSNNPKKKAFKGRK